MKQYLRRGHGRKAVDRDGGRYDGGFVFTSFDPVSALRLCPRPTCTNHTPTLHLAQTVSKFTENAT